MYNIDRLAGVKSKYAVLSKKLRGDVKNYPERLAGGATVPLSP